MIDDLSIDVIIDSPAHRLNDFGHCSIEAINVALVRSSMATSILKSSIIDEQMLRLLTVRDITHDLARESGFESVDDLLRIAKHDRGDKVYLIRFHYLPPGAWDASRPRHRRKPAEEAP